MKDPNKALLVYQADRETLLNDIRLIVKDELSQPAPAKAPLLELDILTPKQVEDLLDISHTTRIEWTKQGIIKKHTLGSKIYYFRSEIKKAFIRAE